MGVSGKRLVIGLAVVLLAGLLAYPFVRRRVLAAEERARAAELSRDRARNPAPSGSIAP